jgi:hypothetical protein
MPMGPPGGEPKLKERPPTNTWHVATRGLSCTVPKNALFREYLTQKEVERLMKAAGDNRRGDRFS